MDKKYACYCGLYCGNCGVKVKVEPAAKVLHAEMHKLGFDQIMSFFPDGEKFWSFLHGMTVGGICISCKAGSGNPACRVRICAKGKNVEMCAFCENYPCEYLAELFDGYPMLENDNSVLRVKGWESWGKLQDDRCAQGVDFSYEKSGYE